MLQACLALAVFMAVVVVAVVIAAAALFTTALRDYGDVFGEPDDFS